MDTQLLRYLTLPPIPQFTPVSSERVAPSGGANRLIEDFIMTENRGRGSWRLTGGLLVVVVIAVMLAVMVGYHRREAE